MNVSASDIRDVSSLPLSAELHDLLATGGFRTVSDLHNISPIDLARELNTSHSIALSIIQTASSSSSSPQQSIVQSLQSVREVKTSSKQLSAVTAKDIIAKIGTGSRALITFCKAIDDMLGGGIQVGQITEFCGVPGIGKTQLAIQLSLNVQIPEVFGGLGGECVYIDTEGSFIVERAAEMASELSNHLNRLARTMSAKKDDMPQQQDRLSIAQSMSSDRFLEGIQVFRVYDQTSLLSTMKHLDAFLRLNTKVKLVVVDSIAFPFRQDLSDQTARNRHLSDTAQHFNRLAYDYHLAIVFVNHVTTRFEKAPDGPGSRSASTSSQRLIPALGELWSHCITNRVMLYWQPNSHRMAALVKSPSMPYAAVPFNVCEKGLRDASNASSITNKRKLSLEESGQP